MLEFCLTASRCGSTLSIIVEGDVGIEAAQFFPSNSEFGVGVFVVGVAEPFGFSFIDDGFRESIHLHEFEVVAEVLAGVTGRVVNEEFCTGFRHSVVVASEGQVGVATKLRIHLVVWNAELLLIAIAEHTNREAVGNRIGVHGGVEWWRFQKAGSLSGYTYYIIYKYIVKYMGSNSYYGNEK